MGASKASAHPPMPRDKRGWRLGAGAPESGIRNKPRPANKSRKEEFTGRAGMFGVTFSAGVAEYPLDGHDLNAISEVADEALQRQGSRASPRAGRVVLEKPLGGLHVQRPGIEEALA